jgi:hypothetical protein
LITRRANKDQSKVNKVSRPAKSYRDSLISGIEATSNPNPSLVINGHTGIVKDEISESKIKGGDESMIIDTADSLGKSSDSHENDTVQMDIAGDDSDMDAILKNNESKTIVDIAKDKVEVIVDIIGAPLDIKQQVDILLYSIVDIMLLLFQLVQTFCVGNSICSLF